jgi:CheY-like chemotaxis protein
MPESILLVDDDPVIRSLGREFLELLLYEVEVAENGEEALEIFRRRGRVDLVILDYCLPGRDGLQVLQDLQALDPEIRVLLSSGYFSSQDMARIKDLGARGFIYKPYRLRELRDLICQVLQGMSGF